MFESKDEGLASRTRWTPKLTSDLFSSVFHTLATYDVTPGGNVCGGRREIRGLHEPGPFLQDTRKFPKNKR